MTLNVAIAGLGTVGTGLLSLLVEDRRFSRLGLKFAVSGVSARNRTRERDVPIDDYRWFDDPVELAADPQTDVFVELIGGADGPAKAAVEAALKAGKPVVTANKALIAEHGVALAKLAEDNGVALRFEAAVAGGTPVVRGIKEGAAPCYVTALSGILNGTCNFILHEMAENGGAFDDVLIDAQKAGFAEADPSFDIDGIDAAHKLTILAMLAFDGIIPKGALSVRGITSVTLDDVDAARELGRTVKLVAEARRDGDAVALRVTPALIPNDHPFSEAKGAGNAVSVDAEPLGNLLFAGPGAGAGATASAVAADLCDIARGVKGPVFATPAENLRDLPIVPADQMESRFFLRLRLKDRPGALAEVAKILADHEVSIASLEQKPTEDGTAPVIMVTHSCSTRAIEAAIDVMRQSSGVDGAPSHLPLLQP